MNALTTQQPYYCLADLAQTNTIPPYLGMFLQEPHEVALGGIAFHSEQEIRRAEMKETESVALYYLGPIDELAQFCSRGRYLNSENGITRFSRSQQVTYWTDSTNARGDGRHFPETSAQAKLFEAPEFSDLKASIDYPATFIEVESNFCVTLYAGYRINIYYLGHVRWTSG